MLLARAPHPVYTTMSSLAPWIQVIETADRSKLELAGLGSFAQVFKIPNTGLVIKRHDPHPVVSDLQPVERQIYERLGRHAFIVRYYGEYSGSKFPNGLVLEYLPGGILSENLSLLKYPKQRTE